jgi:hypothetical protein
MVFSEFVRATLQRAGRPYAIVKQKRRRQYLRRVKAKPFSVQAQYDKE